MERRQSEQVPLRKWLKAMSLLPLAIIPAFLMGPGAFVSFLNNFQFITTYPFLLADSFNKLRVDNAPLNQGSLFEPEPSEGVGRWKLMAATLFWDTPLVISVSIIVSLALGHSSSERAVLILQSVGCLWTAPIAGMLFPVVDVAAFLLNFVPFLMVIEPLEPARKGVEIAITYSANGEWSSALIPGLIFLCAFIRLALGWCRIWIIPGISKFVFALVISVLGTVIISQLPSVTEGAILLKVMMTITTAIMILNYRILNRQQVVFIWQRVRGTQYCRRKRINIIFLFAIYSFYGAIIIGVGTLLTGGSFSYELFRAFFALIVGCYLCVELSKILSKSRLNGWNWFYSKTEPVVDDGVSAIISKLFILCLQGLPK